MKKLSSPRVCLVAIMGILMACSSTSNREATKAPASDDLLELLTGFGESLSKRNYVKAVDYMVPEEKAMMMEGGAVPTDKQKMLLALPLQKLIRHPGIRVENGHIAGIYAVLPNLRQGEANPMAPAESENTTETAAASEETSGAEIKGPMAAQAPESYSNEEISAAPEANANDPKLKAAANKFFAAINKRNWTSALAMMSENEKTFLVDDKGRLKESSKQRLSQMDQKNWEALVMQDGKLTGVTLLLPSD
jgi:hypothetical protein